MPPRETMFRKSYFGRWLGNLVGVEGDLLLLHYMFCHEVMTNPQSKVEEMVFEIGGYELTFGKKYFYLLTRFHFGVKIFLHPFRTLPFDPVYFLWLRRMSP